MRLLTGCLFAALAVAGCGGVPFQLDAPPAFKRYEKTDDFRFITADGVMLRGREVENYPLADLGFWREALRGHLEKRGYLFEAEDCFKTARGLDGCTLDFVVPSGGEDWAFSQTLFVQGDRVLLLEATGPYDRFAPQKAALRASLRTFVPES